MFNHHTNPKTTFHLSDIDIKALIRAKELRKKRQTNALAKKKRHHRFTPVNHEATAVFEHPGGSKDRCRMFLLDISASGIGIAIRGFLHKGTTITIHLRTNEGEDRTLSGIVRWCEYYDKQVHMVGISLAELIDPRYFTTESEWITHSTSTDDNAWMTDRTALAIQDNEMEFKALKMLLLNANVQLSQAETIGAALDRVQEAPYDLLLLFDSPHDKAQTQQSIKDLIAHGYTGPILALTNNSKTRKDILIDAGAHSVIEQPIEIPTLLAKLRDIFINPPSPVDSTAPIHSTLSSEHCSEAFFDEYIKLITDSIYRLEHAMSTDDAPTAINTCTSLYSTGSSFGFPLLTTVAKQALNSLNASSSPIESSTHIRKLIQIIKRLKVPESDKAKPGRQTYKN